VLAVLDLALDGDKALVAVSPELLDQLGEVHLALAHGNLFAKMVALGGEEAVLDVHITHVFAEGVPAVLRVGHAVEDDVGGIEVDAHVFVSDVLDGAQQGNGSLLTRLKQEGQTLFLHLHAQMAQGADGADVVGIAGVGGQKAHVGGNVLGADGLGKGNGLFKILQPCAAVGGGHQTQRYGAEGEVPFGGTGPACPQSGNDNARLLAGGADGGVVRRRSAPG